jgi:hypothetical protein
VQARYYKSARLLKWCDEERRPKEKKKTASRKKPLKLKGDQYDRPMPHYATSINNYFKWRRQVQIGAPTESHYNPVINGGFLRISRTR